MSSVTVNIELFPNVLQYIATEYIRNVSPRVELLKKIDTKYSTVKSLPASCGGDFIVVGTDVKGYGMTCTATDETSDTYSYDLVILAGTNIGIIAVFETPGSKSETETITLEVYLTFSMSR